MKHLTLEENVDVNTYLNSELKSTQRKPKSDVSNVYFTQETEDAIIEYISTSDKLQRDRIYDSKISYAFYKLAENIIHTFKFYYTDINTIEELKHEVVTILLEKLHLYHHSKNINDRLYRIIVKIHKEEYIPNSFIDFTNNSPVVTQEQINMFLKRLNVSDKCMQDLQLLTPPKAYSYFGTITKNYLIVYNKNNYKKLQGHAGVDEIEEDKTYIYDVIKESEDGINLSHFIDQYVKYVDKHLYRLFPKPQDAKTADAIMELFRKRDTLDMFNKKALYIYIREINDVSTPHITKITKKLDTLRKKLYNEYYLNGYINFN